MCIALIIFISVVTIGSCLTIWAVYDIHKPFWGQYMHLKKCRDCGEMQRYQDQRLWVVCPGCGSHKTEYVVARWLCRGNMHPASILYGPDHIRAEEKSEAANV